MHAFAKRVAVSVAAVVAANCAGQEESSISYGLREEISLGIISLYVNQWQEVHGTSSRLGSLHPPEGEKPVVVFVRWSGLDDFASAMDRRVFVEAFLSDRLTLVDSDGFAYDDPTAMPRDLYQMSSSASPISAPADWVVIFWAWVDSDGYTLRVEHPDPGKGDFDVAIVGLP